MNVSACVVLYVYIQMRVVSRLYIDIRYAVAHIYIINIYVYMRCILFVLFTWFAFGFKKVQKHKTGG